MNYRIDFWYRFKVEIRYAPFKIMICLFAVTLVVLTYLIRLAELPFIDISDREKEHKIKVDQFASYFNSFYTAMMCICTLGFGDIYASTLMGRILSSIGFMIGNILLALMVYGISNYLEFGEEEKRAEQMILSEHHKAHLRDASSDVLRTALRLNRSIKNRDAMSMGQRSYYFKEVSNEIRIMRSQ